MSLEELKSTLENGEAYLITSNPNIRYLTDFCLDDGYLLVTRKKSIMLADSRYCEAAGQKARDCDEILLLKRAGEQLNEMLSKLCISTVYTESANLSVADFNRIEGMLEAAVFSKKTDGEISALRRCKKEYEKQRIIAAQRIAEGAFNHILTFIKPGVSEKDIRLELEYFMLKNGGDDLSFSTIAISGENTSKPHGVPTEKKVKSGEFVTMDYGAVVDGYHSDMTRTVAVGSVTDKMAEVYETVLKAQLACLDTLAPGVPCKEADAAARSIISDAGYGDCFGHGTGHGVGIDIHEGPSLSPRSEAVLQPGDVVTDEPGIYIPGEFGVRIEDMAFITDTGYENLTICEKSLIVL